ncbi:MAG: helix-turn-helix domain-containing protein [Kordiimonadaceae bacterium]|nr:helix-turn-helix domain-containing protein [Kordiimonadaceae bacterium]
MNIEEKTVGVLLKETRENKKIHIKAIAADICVRSSFLTAIEESDFKVLPGQTFAIGFVKAYASALGLDAAEISIKFKAEYCPEVAELAAARAEVSAKTAEKVTMNAKPRRVLPAWAMPAFGLVGASAVWVVLGGSFAATVITADTGIAIEEARLAAVQANLSSPIFVRNYTADLPVVAAASMKMVEVADQVIVPQKTTVDTGLTASKAVDFFTAPLQAAENDIVRVEGDYRLEAVEDSWVRLADGGGTEIWSGILREGQTYRPQTGGVLLLSTSNAGGLMLQIGASEAALLGTRGEIVSELKLAEVKYVTLHDGAS